MGKWEWGCSAVEFEDLKNKNVWGDVSNPLKNIKGWFESHAVIASNHKKEKTQISFSLSKKVWLVFPATDLTLRTIQQRRRAPKSNYGILLVIYTYLGPKGFNVINALKLSLVIHSFLGMRIKYYSNYNKQGVWGQLHYPPQPVPRELPRDNTQCFLVSKIGNRINIIYF